MLRVLYCGTMAQGIKGTAKSLEDRRAEREANKDEINRQRRERYASNAEIRSKAVQRATVAVKRDPDKRRDYLLRRKYGISLVQYNEMFVSQGGLCLICGGPEQRVHSTSKELCQLSVDHCHKTGRVRGLLCTKCNHILGLWQDDPEIFKTAIAYLTAESEDGRVES